MYLCLFDVILLYRGLRVEYINLYEKLLSCRVVFMWNFGVGKHLGQRQRTGSRKPPGKGVVWTSWTMVMDQIGRQRCVWLQTKIGPEE